MAGLHLLVLALEARIFTAISWDVWVAVAIAAVAIVLAVLFEQSPLLVFILVGSALCAYIAIRNKFDDGQ